MILVIISIFRPISIMSGIAKVNEFVIKDRLINFF